MSIQILDTPKQALSTALNVIVTERDALTHLEMLYRTNELAQKNIERAVSELVGTIRRGGKLVVCGVGKSGKIGRKLEATMNSVGIHSVFLHPTEALHGDLGVIRSVRSLTVFHYSFKSTRGKTKFILQLDTLLLISFSGRTAELLLMLPHVPPTVPVIAITSHTHPSSCPLLSFNSPDMTILLPAPLHIDEESSIGLSAPTSSTTVALALGDALALATAQNLHTLPGQGPAEVFKGYHPGGAIGAAVAAAAVATDMSCSTISTPATSMTTSPSLSSLEDPSMKLSLDDTNTNSINISKADSICTFEYFVSSDCIPTALPSRSLSSPSAEQKGEEEEPQIRILDILLSAIQNPNSKSWVKLSSTTIIPPNLLRALTMNHIDASSSPRTKYYNVDTPICKVDLPTLTYETNWLQTRASSSLDEVKYLVNESTMTMSDNDVETYMKDVIISVVDDIDVDKVLGFVSGEDICCLSAS